MPVSDCVPVAPRKKVCVLPRRLSFRPFERRALVLTPPPSRPAHVELSCPLVVNLTHSERSFGPTILSFCRKSTPLPQPFYLLILCCSPYILPPPYFCPPPYFSDLPKRFSRKQTIVFWRKNIESGHFDSCQLGNIPRVF